MSSFEDRLWSELVHEHGDRMQLPASSGTRARRRPALIGGTALAAAAAAAAVLVFTATTSTPAYAVTSNSDGTVTVTLNDVRAITAYGITMGLAAAGGQLLGGLLIGANVAGLGWRWIFWVNVPVGVAALAGAAVLLPRESRGQARLDLPGVGLLTAAMALLVTPLAFGREQGWPAWTWACLGASVVAFTGCSAPPGGRAALSVRPGAPPCGTRWRSSSRTRPCRRRV